MTQTLLAPTDLTSAASASVPTTSTAAPPGSWAARVRPAA